MDNAALLWCSVPTLRNSLKAYFQHCGGEGAPVVVTYRVETSPQGSLHLLRDDIPLSPIPSLSYALAYLTQDITNQLVSQSQETLAFHAAGLAYGQQGILLCAPSGSGKSTLAAWLTASGFDFQSDEVVAITPDAHAMYGLTCPIILKHGSAFVWRHWLGTNAEQQVIYSLNGAAWVHPESLRRDSVSFVAHPEIVVFPHYVSNASLTVTPLSPAETVFYLMHQLVNFKRFPDQGLTAITQVAQQITAYRLTYADVTQATAWFESIV